MRFGLKEEELEQIIGVFKEYPGVEEVIIFGSRAMGTFRGNSDVDLAVKGKGFGLQDAINLHGMLEELPLPFMFDVVIYDNISNEALIGHILKHGKVLFRKADSVLSARESGYNRYATGGQWVRLDDVADIYSGGTPSKATPDFWGGDIPWLSAKDMKSFQANDTEDHLTRHGAENATHLVPKGTTLILTRGMTLLSDVPICVAGREMAFNQDVKAIVARDSIDARYLTYALLAAKPQLKEMVELAGHGTGRLPTDRLKAIRIRLPDKDEQHAIARILGALDDKIELNRRMNETLEAMAQELFKSWFVDFEPVRAKVEGQDTGLPKEFAALFSNGFVESEFGMIPEGWRICGLDEIAEYRNGLALQKYPPEERNNESLPIIKIAQLRVGNTEGADRASARLPAEYIVEDGDVLFSWSGSLEVVIWYGGRGALNQHLFKITSNRVPKWYYYLWTKHYLSHFRAIAADKATTMGHIQRHHLSEAKALLPSPELLKIMDKYFAPLIVKTTANCIESRTLTAIRDALLPKLLSGEIRVDNARAREGG